MRGDDIIVIPAKAGISNIYFAEIPTCVGMTEGEIGNEDND
jgi:hypothetical protein